jgi:transposase
VHLLPGSPPSRVPWRRRYDLSIEPGADHGSDQTSRLPQGDDGLAALVKNELHKDPFTGTVFVFRSRKADRLKLIYWDGSGIVLAYKRLEEHTFTWPGIKNGLMTLTHAQFEALFAGVDWRRVHAVQTRMPEAIE